MMNCRRVFSTKVFVRNANTGGRLVCARNLSGEPNKSDGEGIFGKLSGALTPPRLKTAAAGGAIFLVGASTVMYEVGSGFMKLTPYTTGKFGFLVGAASAGAASVVFTKFVSLLSLSPDVVKQRVIEYMKVSSFVEHAFGGDVICSDIVGYRSGVGHVTVKNRSLVWSPTFVEIVMAVRGADNTQGVVTAVATKSMRGTNLGSVCVHLENLQPKFIAGDSDSVAYHKKMAESISINMN